MRRLIRWALNLAAAVSALLCVAACVLWARTFTRPQLDFFVISEGRSYGVGTERGGVIGFLQQERQFYRENDADDVQLRNLGFWYLRITSDGMRRWNLVLPLWFLATGAAAVPTGRLLWRLAARRKVRLGLCPSCGYDLRGTPDRCPECGAVPARKAAT
jgi:hypothetical protein